MNTNYPIHFMDEVWMSAEHLYQAFRHTGNASIQRKVLSTKSPVAAKIVARNEAPSRIDWMEVNVTIMEFVLDLKLAQYFDEIGSILRETGHRSIVEFSKKDKFWGAVPSDGGQLVGSNVLGRLWMRRRAFLKEGGTLTLTVPDIPDMKLFGAFITHRNLMPFSHT